MINIHEYADGINLMTKLNPAISIPVNSDQELALAIDSVNVALQNIHDYLSDHPGKKAKIRFPRGYLGTINGHISKYSWLENSILSKNIAYQHVFVDTLRWLANHTDLFSSGRDMVLKNVLFANASIFEALLYGSITQLNYVEGKVPTRLNRLLKEGVITNSLFTELKWLWDLRQNIHVQTVDVLERERYSATDANRSTRALENFKSALNSHFVKLDFI